MKILGIDTSCDDSCVAIYDTESGSLLADIVHSHIRSTERFGGIVPEVVSREHLKALPLAYLQALETAGVTPDEIDWIAATSQPGLIGALLVGVSFAKGLALSLNKPISFLNHIEAHLFSPLLGDAPPFPWIALVVSGGHTELFSVKDETCFQWLGGTLDDAAGEAFDKVGKLLGLPYPAGPEIDRLVREKYGDTVVLSRFPVAKTDGLHFSFSGLKTAVALETRKGGFDSIQLAAEAQEAILDALVEKVSLASQKWNLAQVVVTGGVACNSRLRKKLPSAYFPNPRHCSDNAAMVARLAALKHARANLFRAPLNSVPSPTYSVL